MDKVKIKPATIMNIVFGGGILLYGLTHSIFKVEPGYNAIIFNKFSGTKDKLYKEGLHFNLPYFEHPIIYDCKMASKIFDVHCGTKGKLNNQCYY